MQKLAFSRSGSTNVIGKKTVPKHTKIPEETNTIIQSLARTAHMTDSEFICEVLMLRAHGEATLRSLNDQRIAVVSGKATE